MKRVLLLSLAVLMLVSVSPQPAHSSMGVFATWWDGKDTDSGFGGGVKYQIPLIPIVGLDLRASYVNFSDADLYTIPLEAVGVLDFGLLYGGAALGYYIWGGNDLSSNNQVGGSILGGVSLGLGGLGVFGELRYNIVKTRLDDRVDVKSDGFNINLGVTF